MQILILGMHRSGTSLAARLVNMMGAYFGPEGLSLGFSSDNPKGFWERRDILQINRALLRHFGCNWFRVDGWDDTKLGTLPAPLTRSIRQAVLELDAHRPWMVKDPRLCITLPCWRPWLEAPVAVVATRHPLSVARSLELRNAIPVEYGLALWEHHAVGIIRHAHDLPRAHVSFEAMLSDPVNKTRALYEELEVHGVQGLRMPRDREILAFVEPKLERARREDAAHKLSPHQKTLHAMLCGEMGFDANIEVSPEARHIMKTLGGKVSGAPVNQ